MKKNFHKKLAIIGMTLLLSACASQGPTNKPSGFLPDYSLLKQVPTQNSGIQVYTYSSPNFTRANYNAVIVQPVILYQTATQGGITSDQIENARVNIQNGIQKIVSRKIPITNSPGPGVANLSVAITGAELQGSSFEPWNLIPISAAIKLASKATGLEQKTPVLVVELKFQDSVTNQLLRETLTTISSNNFSGQVSTSAEFQQLAQQWVQMALQYSQTNNH